ncbi:MAG: hypothetical protein AAGD25_21470 [Cyanobacteria bacterium P01_F01_bin.150]
MALKLSDADKKTIVELYQHPEESTATLASRYAVSSSTISRILKQELSPSEYQNIVQQKKGGGSKPQSRKASSQKPDADSKSSGSSEVSADSLSSKPTKELDALSKKDLAASQPVRKTPSRAKPSKRGRIRQRSSAKAKALLEVQDVKYSSEVDGDKQLSIEDSIMPDTQVQESESAMPAVEANEIDEAKVVAAEIEIEADDLVQEIQSDLLDSEDFEEDLEDDIGDDDLNDDLSDDDLDDDDIDSALELPLDGDHLSILPFSEAKLPRTCYIIIDRSAELITRPLKTFADLGTVPDEEIDEPTLPIFDNHRVAKRFANKRTQRIVKIPDSRVLRKTSPYLMDKGITRLLLDGQVYALLDDEELAPLE